ncbi:uncharacterized protein SPPG_03355 [Spizellomyces punctatus DAOM BR117]|uniref:DUF1294-domain-containing protein n=1 Tax=Spizellomyces punctatus (strain DAOM BR117) TaxID=645134 RepID=A0A0L0HKJ1_SPIPD|nr:uncharacterized protein SPPG_03355 [Spizellomyces punctatus DAOM BR117]KND01553.1 hypothetical protein SPPG_03355 [Spizellomyces punctatus DAOM BR117]|eukprot:XP_016609592.1 hypothetical protein SPPG_03355 [Spizellomyces punctatus DAOM BR117]
MLRQLLSRTSTRPNGVTRYTSFHTSRNTRAYNRPRHHSNQHIQPPEDAPPRILLYIVGGYFAVINAGAVGLFWYDKNQALKRGWRVPEKQLQLTALLGGWVGGLWAMKTFRHKTVKQSFQQPYLLCMAGNIVACVGGIAAWRFNPSFRTAVIKSLGRQSAHIR